MDVAGPVDTQVEPLPLTGERTVPGIAEENYWFTTATTMY